MHGAAIFSPGVYTICAFNLQAAAVRADNPIAVKWMIIGIGNGDKNIEVKMSGSKLAGFFNSKGVGNRNGRWRVCR